MRPEPSSTFDLATLRHDAAPPQHDSVALTKGGRTAEILHNGQTYTLRITRQGKLLLTK